MINCGNKCPIDPVDSLDKFIKAILCISLEKDIRKEVDTLYSNIECLDTDLIIPCLNKNDMDEPVKQAIKSLLDFYYDNIENHINHFDENAARIYLRQLLVMCQDIYRQQN